VNRTGDGNRGPGDQGDQYASGRTAQSTRVGPATCGLLALALFVGGFVANAGCAKLDQLRGEGFDPRTSDWIGQVRPSSPSDGQFTYSTKAREIERSLGVQ
jgi:hypothetical protein